MTDSVAQLVSLGYLYLGLPVHLSLLALSLVAVERLLLSRAQVGTPGGLAARVAATGGLATRVELIYTTSQNSTA